MIARFASRARRALRGLALLAGFTLAAAAFAAGEPSWVAEVLRRPPAPVPADARAIILFDEGVVTVAGDGRRITQRRVVVRVLHREGRRHVIAVLPYQQSSDKVKSMAAWLVRPNGSVRTYDKKEVLDLSLEASLLYTESRNAMIDGSTAVEAGGAFAWEAVLEEPAFMSEGLWIFPSECPVALARLVVRAPAGVRIDGNWLNHPGPEPLRQPASCTWELRDLPAIESEPLDPPAVRITPTVRYDLTWDKRTARPAALLKFDGWSDVARFARRRAGVEERPGAALQARADELCAGKTTAWDQIRALATYVQQLRYVAIAANLRTGGGFTPNPPDAVLRHGYGDCKDKTTLLCALMQARGLAAYPVLCYSGDRRAGRPDWPTPTQFNHMLIALEVDGSVQSPFVVESPELGRLLLFDPTDRFVPLGDYPVVNQGGSVLICKPGNDRLTRVPLSPGDSNLLHRRIAGTIQTNGTVTIRLTDEATGYAAARERERYFDRAGMKKLAEERLRESLAGANVQVAEASEPVGGGFNTRLEFTVPNYAKQIGANVLAFRPLVVSRIPLPTLTAKKRLQPLVLPPQRSHIDAEFELPRGFRVAEHSAALTLERSFGRYTTTTEVKEGAVIFRRRIEIDPVELPPERYEELRAFLDAIRKSENTQIVLERAM